MLLLSRKLMVNMNWKSLFVAKIGPQAAHH